MKLQEILNLIITVVIVPIIPLVAEYLIKWLKKSIDAIQAQTDNNAVDRYLENVEDLLYKIITETTATFTNGLKKDGNFTKHNAEIAFNLTKDKFEKVITEEGKKVIGNIKGDYDTWLKATIETMIEENKSR